jgi:hypothetical protein
MRPWPGERDARFRACIRLDGQMPHVAVFPENSGGKWFTQVVLLLELDHNGLWMGFDGAQNDNVFQEERGISWIDARREATT